MTASAFLTARGLNVTLAGRLVLNDVSLALSSGHLVALVGPNGAGKTTLLRALAGLVPSEGAIGVGGAALSSLSLRERARRFGYLPKATSCTGRWRPATSWRSAVIRMARPTRHD